MIHFRYHFAVEPREGKARVRVWEERTDRTAPRLPKRAIRGTIDVAEIEGRWQPVHLTIGPDASSTQLEEAVILTATALRDVPLGAVVRKALEYRRTELRAEMESIGASDPPEIRRSFERRLEAAEKAAGERRVGRRGKDPSHYREVAEVYRAGFRFGNPTQAVAKHFTISRSTAATWVSRARALGFLDPTTKGRAGGVPQADDKKKRTRTRKGRKS